MFMNNGYGAQGNARARYQSIDLDSQIDAASPHRLIAILFEELMKSIDIMLAAQRAGNRMKMIDKQNRAASILLALETSLDYKMGGELAVNLARIYREARRLVREGGRGSDPTQVEQAREMLSGIAEAWEQIG